MSKAKKVLTTVLMAAVFLLGIVGGKLNWDGVLLAWLYPGEKGVAAVDTKESRSRESNSAAQSQVLYWVDPMHPQYKSDKPGTAPDCGMDLVPIYKDPAETATQEKNEFKIPTDKQQLMGVRYGTVVRAPVSKGLRATGRIAYDETKIARIHPKVEGWIEKVYVDFTGKLVQKGQPLVDIYSPALVSTQSEFLLAAKARDYLGSNSFREISSGALSLYDSARKRLLLWDIDEKSIEEIEKAGQPKKALTLYSPISGFVLDRKAYDRQRITPDTELYAIADLSNVWVLADIYEYESKQIQPGQKAQLELSYFPGKRLAGVVDYIYPQLEPSTRTLKVRIQLPNPHYQLKPDMYVNVTFNISYGTQIVVPAEAVLDSGAEQVVFVAHENGFFEPRKVKLGAEAEGRYVVLEGLKPGERVVTSANFLIDSESRLKSAMNSMAGMGHGSAPAKMGEEDRQEGKHRH